MLIVIGLYFFPGKFIFAYGQRLKAEFKESQERLQASHELVRNFSNPQKAIEDIEAKARVYEAQQKAMTPVFADGAA